MVKMFLMICVWVRDLDTWVKQNALARQQVNTRQSCWGDINQQKVVLAG